MTKEKHFNDTNAELLPGLLGIVITGLGKAKATSEMPVKKQLLAPNGYLHAGSVVTLADITSGFACMSHLPDGATAFTTIELKTNHLGTARDGTLECTATCGHLGRTTQVWDAVVTHRDTGKTLVLFRCTQLILYAK
jgi:uncharacterized protein (TIGR00369 family)